MYKNFLKTTNDEVLLMYLSEGYANGSGQGDSHIVGNLFTESEIELQIEKWKDNLIYYLKETTIPISKVFEEGKIQLTQFVYSKDDKYYHIYDDTDENRKLIKEIEEKAEYGIDGYDIGDVISIYASITIIDDELEFHTYVDGCYQSCSNYIVIKKIKMDDIRYCVIVERPVSPRNSGQFILAGPYMSLEEAEQNLINCSEEKDMYGQVRIPYIIATHINDKWLKHQINKE